ncbi:MAG: CPBP family intramembrane metalloprotease [Deltaproteobacteria bacterium]|nr:MAG: CPBP family intramembrane metalloprotease [Deltaproteobacteria bacterium]
MIAMIAGRVGASPFRIMVVESIALAAVITAVAAARWPLVDAAYRRAGFSVFGYAAVLLAAPVVLLVITGYVDLLARAVGVQAPGELAGFDGHSLAWAVAVIAVVPPLFEELAFRGLMFGGLLTHMPLGLYLCWLRERSRSVWPSTFAHFCHNFGVIVAELYGWT